MITSQLLTTIRLGVKSLTLHKLRAALTMLGIIFGVCSVIAMLAIGEGASYEAQEAIKKLGSRNIIVRSLKPVDDAKASSGGMGGRPVALDYGLKYEDAARIQSTIPGVRHVLPMRIIRETANFERNKINCQIIGTLPSYADITGVETLRGRFLTHVDEQNQDNVCVVTAGLAERLFPFQDPLQHTIKVDIFYFRVVGVIQEKNMPEQRTQSGKMEGEPMDNNLYIPLSTSRSRFGETLIKRSAGSMEMETVQLHQITVEMADTPQVEIAEPQIKTLLKKFHERSDYEMIVPLQLLRQAEQTKRIFNIVLGSIAAISLLVGGIGIMNIMLATVTERTREIGVRRALGARKSDITMQFLVETIVLSVGGGLIGVAIGIIVPYIVAHVADMKTIVTPWSVVIAFTISAAVGVIFGIYPAKSAAELDPIEALRHE
ncbi:MAG TPA: ABC transporter permease [Methylomirabilota bacterium]|nr:ABC transporter permease [Methylomirabilota bacterium]